jgi:tRNA-binding protein
MSQVLVVGFPDAEGEAVLFAPDGGVTNGARLF